MRKYGVQFAVGEAERLKVIGEEANGVLPDQHIAATAYIGARRVTDSMLVDQWVTGENGVSELMSAVIDLEVEIGVRILIEGIAQLIESEMLVALIHIHLLQAKYIGIGLLQELCDLVSVCFACLPHGVGVVGQDSEFSSCGLLAIRVEETVGDKEETRSGEQKKQDNRQYFQETSHRKEWELFRGHCDKGDEHLFHRYASVLESVAVDLCVVVEVVRVAEEVVACAEYVTGADVGARQSDLEWLLDLIDVLGLAGESFSLFVPQVGVGVLVTYDGHGVGDAYGAVISGKNNFVAESCNPFEESLCGRVLEPRERESTVCALVVT